MNQHFRTILRVYLGISLVGAAFFSPPLHSLLPLAFLGLNIYIWLRASPIIDLAASYSAIYVVPLLWEPSLGNGFPALFSLPLLAYVDILLKRVSGWGCMQHSRASRRPTELGVILLSSLAMMAGLAVFLASWTLGLATIASFLYFTVVSVLILWSIPGNPLQASKKFLRVLAGNQARIEIEILNLTRLGGHFYLHPVDSWLKITSTTFSLNKPKVSAVLSLVPPLAGPVSPVVQAVVLDPWGLSQVRLQLQPVQLNISPRARYAGWLAKKYLETARPGTVVSQTPSSQMGGLHVARKGGEYYGSRPYMAGDNLNVIDWKHSAKLGRIIVQEFVEPYTTSPLLVVNLAAGNEEEADSLAFSIVTTALTLAKEGIPAGIAAYNQSVVVLVTDMLGPLELVRKALELTESISRYQAPAKYLKPVDISKLRINLAKLKGIPLDSAQKLANLLSFEYTAFKAGAELNPATIAVKMGLNRGKKMAQLLIISYLNHDVESLMLLASSVGGFGLKALFLEVGPNSLRHPGQLNFRPRSQLTNRVLSS